MHIQKVDYHSNIEEQLIDLSFELNRIFQNITFNQQFIKHESNTALKINLIFLEDNRTANIKIFFHFFQIYLNKILDFNSEIILHNEKSEKKFIVTDFFNRINVQDMNNYHYIGLNNNSFLEFLKTKSDNFQKITIIVGNINIANLSIRLIKKIIHSHSLITKYISFIQSIIKKTELNNDICCLSPTNKSSNYLIGIVIKKVTQDKIQQERLDLIDHLIEKIFHHNKEHFITVMEGNNKQYNVSAFYKTDSADHYQHLKTADLYCSIQQQMKKNILTLKLETLDTNHYKIELFNGKFTNFEEQLLLIIRSIALHLSIHNDHKIIVNLIQNGKIIPINLKTLDEELEKFYHNDSHIVIQSYSHNVNESKEPIEDKIKVSTNISQNDPLLSQSTIDDDTSLLKKIYKVENKSSPIVKISLGLIIISLFVFVAIEFSNLPQIYKISTEVVVITIIILTSLFATYKLNRLNSQITDITNQMLSKSEIEF